MIKNFFKKIYYKFKKNHKWEDKENERSYWVGCFRVRTTVGDRSVSIQIYSQGMNLVFSQTYSKCMMGYASLKNEVQIILIYREKLMDYQHPHSEEELRWMLDDLWQIMR